MVVYATHTDFELGIPVNAAMFALSIRGISMLFSCFNKVEIPTGTVGIIDSGYMKGTVGAWHVLPHKSSVRTGRTYIQRLTASQREPETLDR